MFVFDQLKKNDAQLRILAIAVLAGLGVLAAGLWWVQIVSTRDYQANLEMQSFRSVRIPAVRGKILDRNGTVLAENRPTYNISLYLDELRKLFDTAYSTAATAARTEKKRAQEAQENALGRSLTRQEKRQFILTSVERGTLRQMAREQVASNVLTRLSQLLRLPSALSLDVTNFERHYRERLALPYPVLKNVSPAQIALFEEQCSGLPGVDLELQSTRVYPLQTTAAHVVGCLKRDDSSAEGEDAFFSYRLPDYKGELGVEAACDAALRGQAGAKSVLVNNLGYRQAENVWVPARSGKNVVLTIDLSIQRAAEHALPIFGAGTRGAAVVMDVHTGDILAMASAPSYNPNFFVQGFPLNEAQRMNDPALRPQRNRATQDIYEPGSIFKTIVGLACLEAGINPHEQIRNPGYIYVGKHRTKDLAPPGDYDFKLALIHSSNTYFITNGLRAGVDNIVRLAEHLHLGESCGLKTRQESRGIFPTLKRINSNWFDGDTANICIGQGEVSVTPLQMAVMTAALANGGKILWPRLVERIESESPLETAETETPPRGNVRDQLQIKPQSLAVLREAMLADVEDPGGTGTRAAVPGFRICGKTGTAQVTNRRNQLIDHTTWFISFGPYEQPRYAVVVMVEGGSSGGGDCAPIASHIYRALIAREAGNQRTMANVTK